MSLQLIHGTVKRSLEMKTVMRFTKVKEKIIKNKPINSTDEGKGRHRKVIRIGAFALVFVVLFSFVSTFFKMTDAVNIATIEGFYKEPKNTIDVMMISTGLYRSAEIRIRNRSAQQTRISLRTHQRVLKITKDKHHDDWKRHGVCLLCM